MLLLAFPLLPSLPPGFGYGNSRMLISLHAYIESICMALDQVYMLSVCPQLHHALQSHGISYDKYTIYDRYCQYGLYRRTFFAL